MTQLHALSVLAATSQFSELEAKYQSQLAHPTDPFYESVRADYFKQLATIYLALYSQQTSDGIEKLLESIKEEICKYPPAVAPSAKLFIGSWGSPPGVNLYVLHEDLHYLPRQFAADGSWNILPLAPGSTVGKWMMNGFVVNITYHYADTIKPTNFTILLLTANILIQKEGKDIYILTRIAPTN